MKKTLAFAARNAAFCLAVTLAAGAASCASKGNGNDRPAAAAGTPAASAGNALPNYRYIDADSVSANYNLAKDFKEAALKTYDKLEKAQNAKAAEIQRFGQTVEDRMRTNYYVGKEQEYESDMRKLQKMQRDAESYMANLQRTSQQELAQQQIELNDSLESFLKDYNVRMGYDAIFYKAAGALFNPALDITKEVTDGLNARYNKVEGKK